MKNRGDVVVLFCVLCAAGVFGFLLVKRAKQLPPCYLEPATLDLGELEAGTMRDFTVDFVNPTDESQELQSVVGSCGCVSLSPQTGVVEPHSRLKLVGRISVSNAAETEIIVAAIIKNASENHNVSGTIKYKPSAQPVGVALPLQTTVGDPTAPSDALAPPNGAYMPEGIPGADWQTKIQGGNR